jgi:hypothetical protein
MLILTIGSLWVKTPATMCIGSWTGVKVWSLLYCDLFLVPRSSCHTVIRRRGRVALTRPRARRRAVDASVFIYCPDYLSIKSGWERPGCLLPHGIPPRQPGCSEITCTAGNRLCQLREKPRISKFFYFNVCIANIFENLFGVTASGSGYPHTSIHMFRFRILDGIG